MAIENGKLFKGILQYSAEQFKSVTKEAGYIYFVRKDTTKLDGDAEVWFGTRRYGNVEATKLAGIEASIESLGGRVDDIEAALGQWASLGENLETVAKVVASHETRLGGHDSKILALETSLAEGGDTAKAIAAAEDAAKEYADDAIEALDLANTYDAKGAAAAAETAAKGYADDEIAKLSEVYDTKGDAAQALADAKADAAEKYQVKGDYEAAGTAAGLNAAMDARMTTVEGDVATLKAIDHDAYKSADEALESKLQGKIDLKASIEYVDGTFLKSADKYDDTEVRNLISAETGARETLATTLRGEIKTAQSAAETAAKGYADAEIAKLSEVYDAKGTADELNTAMNERVAAIETLIAGDEDNDVINKVSEIINFFEGVKEDEVYTSLVEKVAANETAIANEATTRGELATTLREEIAAAETAAKAHAEEKATAAETAAKDYTDARETAIMQVVNAIDHRVYYGGDDAE